MKSVGVSVIPGSDGVVGTVEEGLEIASNIGYPIIIKAASGGGGRGMRVVNSKDEFEMAFNTATSEAKISFNDSNVYIEKFFISPKHIEIQIICDGSNNAYSLLYRNIRHFLSYVFR